MSGSPKPSDHQVEEGFEHEADRGKDGEIGLAELSLQHDGGHLLHPESPCERSLHRLALPEVGLVDLREEVDRAMVAGAEAAGDVRESLAMDAGDEPGEDMDPDAPQRAGAELRARGVPLLGEAATEDQIGAVAPGRLEDPRQLIWRVLAIGVEVGDVLEAVLLRIAVAGLEGGTEADVKGKYGYLGAGVAGRVNRVGVGAVVDDENR